MSAAWVAILSFPAGSRAAVRTRVPEAYLDQEARRILQQTRSQDVPPEQLFNGMAVLSDGMQREDSTDGVRFESRHKWKLPDRSPGKRLGTVAGMTAAIREALYKDVPSPVGPGDKVEMAGILRDGEGLLRSGRAGWDSDGFLDEIGALGAFIYPRRAQDRDVRDVTMLLHPALSPLCKNTDDRVCGLTLFHELAHYRGWLSGDVTERFAYEAEYALFRLFFPTNEEWSAYYAQFIEREPPNLPRLVQDALVHFNELRMHGENGALAEYARSREPRRHDHDDHP